MKTEELNVDNVGRPVLIDSINGFDNARAIFRAWSKDEKTAIVTLDSSYGKGFLKGRLLEVKIGTLTLQERPSR
jgi:hypothetical protein